MSKNTPTPSESTSLANSAMGMVFANGAVTTDANGWTLIPFGMWPHSQGLQKFGMKEAEAIVAEFKGLAGRLKRAITGLPIFKGHPDVPGYEEEFPDKTEFGQIADMEVRDDGLALQPVLSQSGADLVTKEGYKFVSPYWDAVPTGQQDGHQVWSPTKIKSVGLVKRPNIPNKSLANNAIFPMKEKLLTAISLAADASDEAILAKVTALANSQTAIANAESKMNAAEADAKEAKAQLANAISAKDAAVTALANERKDRIEQILRGAIKDGRITAAQKELYRSRIANSFELEVTALENMAPTIKTNPTVEQKALEEIQKKLALLSGESLANDAMDGDGDVMANVRKLSHLVANEMESPACKNIKSPAARHNAAWANVLKAHPNFAKMDMGPGGADDATDAGK